MEATILRRKQVENIVGLKHSSIYAKMADGSFPPAIKLSTRAVGWLSSDIQAWIDDRISESRGRAA